MTVKTLLANLMQRQMRLSDAILPPRALDKRLQEDWAKDAREGPRVLMSLRVNFGSMG